MMNRSGQVPDSNPLLPPLILLCAIGQAFAWQVVLDPDNPVFSPRAEEWDSADVADPCLVTDSFPWRLFYDGNGGQGYDIGLATSADNGATWQRTAGNQPVVARASHSIQWESNHVTSPCVVRHGTVDFLWYAGTASSLPAVGYQIGLATSSDGYTWVKHNGGVAPVLPLGAPGSGEDFSISEPHVLWDVAQNRFRMWYAGAYAIFGIPRFRIYTAESTDGIHWTGRTLVLDDGYACSAPWVTVQGGMYRMVYAVATSTSGFDQLRLRTSADGYHWSASYDALLNKADVGTWTHNHIYSPYGINESTHGFDLYFCGHDAAGVWRIGRARVTSPSPAGAPALVLLR